MFMQQLPKPGPGAWVAVDECERTSTSAPLNTPAWYIVVFASGEPISSAGVPYTVTVPGVFDAVRNSATASAAARRGSRAPVSRATSAGRASERSSAFMRRTTSAAALFSVGVSWAARGAAQATRATTASDGTKRIGCDLCGAGGVLRDPQEVTERCGCGSGLNQRSYNWLTGGPRGRCIAIREVPPIL